MSDENKEVDWSATVATELKNRISELEELKRYLDKGGLIEQILENIEKMKKTWDENIESFLKQVDDRFDTRDEEIAELKEQIKYCNVQDGEIATVLHLKTDNIIEVLRDLGKKVYNYIGAKNFGSWNDFIEKLDSQGKTEKKEVQRLPCGNDETDLRTAHEASGGEKERKTSCFDSQTPWRDSSDSKPPEPREDLVKDVRQYPPLLIPYLKTTRELGYEMVKREDLQFLIRTWELSDMKKMHNYPRFKGIKEAYNIE